jgi:hypothetical protein
MPIVNYKLTRDQYRYDNAAVVPINTILLEFETTGMGDRVFSTHVQNLGTSGQLQWQASGDGVCLVGLQYLARQ